MRKEAKVIFPFPSEPPPEESEPLMFDGHDIAVYGDVQFRYWYALLRIPQRSST